MKIVLFREHRRDRLTYLVAAIFAISKSRSYAGYSFLQRASAGGQG
jgi:hypothetical protein